MKTAAKIIIVAVLAGAVGAVLLAKRGTHPTPSADSAGVIATPADAATPAAAKLPRLLDLGAGKCVPCKMMVPILEDLKRECAGRLSVEFIDVWQDPDAGKRYGIEMIPTQIFFDAAGAERFRHTGFLGKEEILAKWRELGVDTGTRATAPIVREEPVEVDTRPRDRVFTSLSRAVEGVPLVALGAAFVWGILSIVLSPCHLASLPLIVGFISGQGRMGTGRAFSLSSLFAVGILITIAAIGLITAAAGRIMGDVGATGNYLVAAIFFVVGLHLLGVIPMPWSGAGQVNMRSRGPLAAFLLGLIFGIALGPCTFAYMAPMLAVTFKLARSAPIYGVSLLLAYGIGHCTVIVLAGTFTELVERYLKWNEQSRGLAIVKSICGVLVSLGGIWLIYTAA